jgi:hypothetical protein
MGGLKHRRRGGVERKINRRDPKPRELLAKQRHEHRQKRITSNSVQPDRVTNRLGRRDRVSRQRPHRQHPDNTILVLDLIGCLRLEDWSEDDSLSNDFSDSGFIEVWISDHSSIDGYGEVTAIGLFPRQVWGIRGQSYLWAPLLTNEGFLAVR